MGEISREAALLCRAVQYPTDGHQLGMASPRRNLSCNSSSLHTENMKEEGFIYTGGNSFEDAMIKSRKSG